MRRIDSFSELTQVEKVGWSFCRVDSRKPFSHKRDQNHFFY